MLHWVIVRVTTVASTSLVGYALSFLLIYCINRHLVSKVFLVHPFLSVLNYVKFIAKEFSPTLLHEKFAVNLPRCCLTGYSDVASQVKVLLLVD